jgi:hypothetical protein
MPASCGYLKKKWINYGAGTKSNSSAGFQQAWASGFELSPFLNNG